MASNVKNDNLKGPGIAVQALEKLVDILGIGLFKINLKTGAISLNLNTTKFTGHDMDDLPKTDQTRDTLIVPEDHDLVNKAVNSVISGGSDHYHIEYRMRRVDSSIVSFDEAGFISEYAENGEPLCMAGMALDLSRQKWAEEKARDMEMEVRRLALNRDDKLLAEENRLLRAANAAAAVVIGGFQQDYAMVLIQSLQMLGECVGGNYVGIWRNVERDGSLCCYLKYNWMAKAHFVGNEENKIYFNYNDLMPNWREKLAEKHYVLCDGNGISREFLDTYDMNESKSLMLLPFYLHGGFWGMIGFARGEERPFTLCEAETLHTGTSIIAFSMARHETLGKINMDREKAMANTLAKGEFLSRMSHEMRTPLNAIIGMTNIALKEKDQAKIMDYLKKVEISSHLMLNIINDVLDMSKIEAGKLEVVMEPFDFNAMIMNAENIVKVKIDEKQQQFIVNCDETLTNTVISDEHRLLQVIINLLNNAMKFTPDRGKISLTATKRDIGNKRVKLRVDVQDSGIGLSTEQQKRLFNAFEQADGSITRKYGGTGLGLAICKKILNALGGDIWVISRPEQGACFFFELDVDTSGPIHSSAEKESAAVSANKSGIIHDWSKYTILLADDIDINREIIEISLRDTGVKIVSAGNGVEVIAKFTQRTNQFDLILMDVQMPVMDGLSATQKIRQMDDPHAKKIPIIAMTANAFKEDIATCLEAGMNEHVAKPIDMDSFIGVLEKYLKD
ncbi:MAG: ATP-binding protein [Treponema sp.]|nr:ATP-binding protein [Treponema sp.]